MTNKAGNKLILFSWILFPVILLVGNFLFFNDAVAIDTDCPSAMQTVQGIVFQPTIFGPSGGEITVSDNGVNTNLQAGVYEVCNDWEYAPECFTQDYCAYMAGEIIEFSYWYDSGSPSGTIYNFLTETGTSGCYAVGGGWPYKYRFGDVLTDYPTTPGNHTLYLKVKDYASHSNPSYSCVREAIWEHTYTIPSYRQENCCDGPGWNNATACGGCCGRPDTNCVGYDISTPYYWHRSNEVWQCQYVDNQNSIYHFVENCEAKGTGWSCQSGSCVYTPPANNPPDYPTIAAPPHNTWINYNPTFQVGVTDPDGDNIWAYFWLNGHPTPYNWGI